jgi:hypothetical protein
MNAVIAESNIVVERLSALITYSPQPERMANFYRTALRIPVEPAQHGHLGNHFEAFYKGTQYAFWPTDSTLPQLEHPTIVPSFRVNSVRDVLVALKALHIDPLHEPLDIGEGKLVVTLQDPDGKLFRLIEIKQ